MRHFTLTPPMTFALEEQIFHQARGIPDFCAVILI